VAADAKHMSDFAVDQIFGDEVGSLHSRHVFHTSRAARIAAAALDIAYLRLR
jgi:hypothetical protein